MQLPTHCYSCGAYLMGGATVHAPGCAVVAMLADVLGQLPDAQLVEPIIDAVVEQLVEPLLDAAFDEGLRRKLAALRALLPDGEPIVAELQRKIDRLLDDAEAALLCTCRACGHDADVHVYDGSCLECGRVQCWS